MGWLQGLVHDAGQVITNRVQSAGPIKGYSGDALENLATAGAVPPSDVLPVGLTILSALAQLCRSDSASVLQRAA